MDEIEIAGKKTIKEWRDLVGVEDKLKIDYTCNEKWDKVYEFFELRICTRYIKPIDAILNMKSYKGEGFAVVSLQCSLIETIESFINGWLYHNVKGSGIGLGWYYGEIKNTCRAKNPLKPNENLKNEDIFIWFFNNRQPFDNYYIDGLDFFKSVRCGLLHETQTKNGWTIRSSGSTKSIDKTIIYRENFQKDIMEVIETYKKGIVNGEKVWNIEAEVLRKNFISKFNHLCAQSIL